ncbi:MAG: hypothetical protein ACKOXP_04890 [Flavobacteriales bacterium]
MNKAVGLVLGAGVLYGIVRLLRMQNVSEMANAKLVNPRIHSVNLGGITFRTEVEINNPSRDSVKLTKPVVTLTSKGKMLAQSDAEDTIIAIKPLGLTKIDTIELELDWFTLKGLVTNIVKNIPKAILFYNIKCCFLPTLKKKMYVCGGICLHFISNLMLVLVNIISY